jgi:hypothetical protein
MITFRQYLSQLLVEGSIADQLSQLQIRDEEIRKQLDKFIDDATQLALADPHKFLETCPDHRLGRQGFIAYAYKLHPKEMQPLYDELRAHYELRSKLLPEMWREQQVEKDKLPHYYIRIGEIPKDEISRVGQHYRNHTWKARISAMVGEEIPEQEEGVSVYEVQWNKEKWRWEIESGNEQMLAGLSELLFAVEEGERKAYLVQGKEVGEGEDGEPLLKEVKILQELKLNNIYNYDNEHLEEDFPTDYHYHPPK